MLDLFGTPPIDHSGCKVRVGLPGGMAVSAVFSPDRRYRYQLEHRWSTSPAWMWLMMNPSGANEVALDLTVAKTGRMAHLGGAGGQLIANACALCATDKTRLLETSDPVGPDNARHILAMAAASEKIIVAHGQLPGGLQHHARAAVRLLVEAGHPLHVLRLSADGTPMHPLSRGKGFIPVGTVPSPWRPA